MSQTVPGMQTLLCEYILNEFWLKSESDENGTVCIGFGHLHVCNERVSVCAHACVCVSMCVCLCVPAEQFQRSTESKNQKK